MRRTNSYLDYINVLQERRTSQTDFLVLCYGECSVDDLKVGDSNMVQNGITMIFGGFVAYVSVVQRTTG